MERKVRGGRLLFIILSTAKTCTNKSLLTPNTTLTANCMTSDVIVSLYPKATFISRVGYYVFKKVTRPWRVPFSRYLPFGYVQPKVFATSGSYKVLKLKRGLAEERYIGDVDCWVMRYDEAGNNKCGRDWGDMEQEAWLNELSWRTRVEKGVVYMDIRRVVLARSEM
ncbi:hypothetical protein HWV62_4303, partial [Athelia sp. TMB]